MSIFDKVVQAFKDVDENEKYFAQQRKQQEALTQYWERYWSCALVMYEIICANSTLLKVTPPREPKWLMPVKYAIDSLNSFNYVLNRVNTNTPVSDGAVISYEVASIIKDYLTLCRFSGVNVDCREDTYKYYLTVGGSGFTLGRPMSNKIGMLFVNRFYDAVNNLYYYAFDIKYFDDSTYGAIRDGTIISLYHEGQFMKNITSRDTFGNPCLSRLPFKVRLDYGYLVIL